MRFTTLLLSVAPWLCASIHAGPVLAGEIEAKSAVVAVVVHPDAATVTREATVDLPAGVSTVLIKGAPYPVIPDSLRATGEARTPLMIGAVEERLAPTASRPEDDAITLRLKEIRFAREGLETSIAALKAEQAMIVRYSQASPEKIASDARPLPVAEWTTAFETVAAAHSKVGESLREANAKLRDLDEEAHGLESRRPAPTTRLARDIAIGLESPAGGPAKIIVTYQTAAAGWRPAYEARLDTGDKDRKPALELLRRAVVTQRTGED
ncbi:MAG: mucoidy inhibitor MuiA family protein, partial [Methylocystis sp.]